jgi:hypothetical protein
MGRQGKRAGTAMLVLAALVFGPSACGGKDSSSKPATSASVGPTAATGALGSTGSTGATGAKRSGGSKAPSTPTAQTPTPTSPSANTKKPGRKQSSKKPGPAYDPQKPTTGELANLYSESKQVCQALSLKGLARE